jgi:ParB family chromosome partitioning protein
VLTEQDERDPAVIALQAAPAHEDELAHVAIDRLRESKTNPRKTFGETAIWELAKSVAAHGVLVPLLVRPLVNSGQQRLYEVVAGGRRLRAAKAAGLARVPVRIHAMTDAQALEVQLIENLQREDVHPLEEAVGLRALMTSARCDVDAVAAKIGKSASYVYQRLKLCDLIAAAARAFADGDITAGHAILIARLQPKDQALALQTCAKQEWDPATGREEKATISVHHLANWIARVFHLDLHSAAFPKEDATLVPAAGACTTCTKRTGSSPGLFSDIAKKDTCTERACFQVKVAAFVERQRADLKAAAAGVKVTEVCTDYGDRQQLPKGALGPARFERVESNKDRCEHTRPALVVQGREAGHSIEICSEPSCTKHRAHVTHTNGRGGDDQRGAERRKEQQRRAESAARRETLAAIGAKITEPLQAEDLKLIIRVYLREMHHDSKRALLALWELEPARVKRQYGTSIDYDKPVVDHFKDLTGTADLRYLLLQMALINNTIVGSWNAQPPAALIETARRYHVEPAKAKPIKAAKETTMKPSKAGAKRAAKKPAPKSGKKPTVPKPIADQPGDAA